MGAFYPLHQRSEAAYNLPLLGDVEIREFYNFIDEQQSAEDADGQEAGESGEQQQPQEKAATDEVDAPEKGKKEEKKGAFGTLQAFIDVLERSRRRLKDTGSLLIHSSTSKADLMLRGFKASKFINAVTAPLLVIQVPLCVDPMLLSFERAFRPRRIKAKYFGVQSKWPLNSTQPEKRTMSALNKLPPMPCSSWRPDLI